MKKKAYLLIPILFFITGVITNFNKHYTFSLNSKILGVQTQISKPPSKESASTPTITPTLSPTPTPTPTLLPTPTLIPTLTPKKQITLSIEESMLDQVNEFRLSKGMNLVIQDSKTCDFASTRVKEIAVNFSHEGFNNRINNHTLPYPTFTKVAENLAENTNYPDIVNIWIGSSIHRQNLLSDTPFACIRKYQNFYVYEGWKP